MVAIVLPNQLNPNETAVQSGVSGSGTYHKDEIISSLASHYSTLDKIFYIPMVKRIVKHKTTDPSKLIEMPQSGKNEEENRYLNESIKHFLREYFDENKRTETQKWVSDGIAQSKQIIEVTKTQSDNAQSLKIAYSNLERFEKYDRLLKKMYFILDQLSSQKSFTEPDLLQLATDLHRTNTELFILDCSFNDPKTNYVLLTEQATGMDFIKFVENGGVVYFSPLISKENLQDLVKNPNDNSYKDAPKLIPLPSSLKTPPKFKTQDDAAIIGGELRGVPSEAKIRNATKL